MENKTITESELGPEIILDVNGTINISGRSMMEDPSEFYAVVYSWIKEYLNNVNKSLSISFELSYFNSSSSKQILRLLMIIDDAEIGIDEEALLHLYNGLASEGGHLLMTAAKPPGLWGISLKDLESRLKSMPCVEIGLPDDRLLEAVFAKYFADRQLLVGADVVSYLLPRIERSLSMAQKIVEKIDQHSLAAGRKVTLPLVRQVLASNFD